MGEPRRLREILYTHLTVESFALEDRPGYKYCTTRTGLRMLSVKVEAVDHVNLSPFTGPRHRIC
jgi:hypothetical protein